MYDVQNDVLVNLPSEMIALNKYYHIYLST